MCMALAAISCSHANKALLNLIKIHARNMEAGGFGKGYLSVCVCMCVCVCVCVCVFMIERESASKCSLMLEIKDEN